MKQIVHAMNVIVLPPVVHVTYTLVERVRGLLPQDQETHLSHQVKKSGHMTLIPPHRPAIYIVGAISVSRYLSGSVYFF